MQFSYYPLKVSNDTRRPFFLLESGTAHCDCEPTGSVDEDEAWDCEDDWPSSEPDGAESRWLYSSAGGDVWNIVPKYMQMRCKLSFVYKVQQQCNLLVYLFNISKQNQENL